MILCIKNMVCRRCEIVVRQIIENFGLHLKSVSLGEVVITENISYIRLKLLDKALKETGLELVFDKKNLIDQKIKRIISETILYSDEPLNIKFSCYLGNMLNYSYTYLSNIFSEVNGISMEQYIILKKIERVKSMLLSGSGCLSAIAYKLNYSSVGHLSAQFKKVTGLTAKDYKLKKETTHTTIPIMMAV